jgi:hypothetical protein
VLPSKSERHSPPHPWWTEGEQNNEQDGCLDLGRFTKSPECCKTYNSDQWPVRGVRNDRDDPSGNGIKLRLKNIDCPFYAVNSEVSGQCISIVIGSFSQESERDTPARKTYCSFKLRRWRSEDPGTRRSYLKRSKASITMRLSHSP